jgi:hypothetical protein
MVSSAARQKDVITMKLKKLLFDNIISMLECLRDVKAQKSHWLTSSEELQYAVVTLLAKTF